MAHKRQQIIISGKCVIDKSVFSFLLLAFAADSRAAVDMDRKAARRPRLLLLTRHAAISPDRFDHKECAATIL